MGKGFYKKGEGMLIDTIICFIIIILILLLFLYCGFKIGRHVHWTEGKYRRIWKCKHPDEYIVYIKKLKIWYCNKCGANLKK